MQRFVLAGAPRSRRSGPSRRSACERLRARAGRRSPARPPALAFLFLRGLRPARGHLFVSGSLIYLFVMALERDPAVPATFLQLQEGCRAGAAGQVVGRGEGCPGRA